MKEFRIRVPDKSAARFEDHVGLFSGAEVVEIVERGTKRSTQARRGSEPITYKRDDFQGAIRRSDCCGDMDKISMLFNSLGSAIGEWRSTLDEDSLAGRKLYTEEESWEIMGTWITHLLCESGWLKKPYLEDMDNIVDNLVVNFSKVVDSKTF